MKHIKTEKEELSFKDAISDFFKGKIIRSYMSEMAYYIDENEDIYTTQIRFSDKDVIEADFRMIKLDDEVWNSGEVQGKWNVICHYKDINNLKNMEEPIC